MNSTKARRARARVAVDKVRAVGAVLARVALALVDILLAARATEAWQARAHKAVHAVFADSAIVARVWWERENALRDWKASYEISDG